MKKLFIILALFACAIGESSAQKFALVDMDYILSNIPAYERANEQLNQVSRRFQEEVETLTSIAQDLYKNYQSEAVFLSAEQKKKKEDAIVTKENEARELKRKYFAPEGELYKKRESLIKPIQDEIYNAVKEIAKRKGYSMILDKASAGNIVYASTKIDISNEVLEKLGYSN
ncbi:MAG: OmpH family outer membrane protein [Bacteroidaceae bacterium]|nr:OmpH family outer membrane protein [Bacteroidaceae bacterium]